MVPGRELLGRSLLETEVPGRLFDDVGLSCTDTELCGLLLALLALLFAERAPLLGLAFVNDVSASDSDDVSSRARRGSSLGLAANVLVLDALEFVTTVGLMRDFPRVRFKETGPATIMLGTSAFAIESVKENSIYYMEWNTCNHTFVGAQDIKKQRSDKNLESKNKEKKVKTLSRLTIKFSLQNLKF